MATFSFNQQLTYAEIVKMFDNKGMLIPTAEVLERTNAIVQDLPMIEANEKIRHRTSQRNSLPAGKTKRYNDGVVPTASSRDTSLDVIELIEDFSDVDEDLANHTGNPAGTRADEDRAFVEGIGQTQASRFFYGNNAADPDQMTGLAPRMSTVNNNTVISNGGSGANLTSIYLVQPGRDTVFGIFPTGSSAGLDVQDKGLVRNQDDTSGKVRWLYETQFKLQFGLVVRDQRSIGRVANIKATGSTYLFDWEAVIDVQTQMKLNTPTVCYVSRRIWAQILKEALNKPNNLLNMQNVFGDGMIPTLNGMPVRLSEAISESETAIS